MGLKWLDFWRGRKNEEETENCPEKTLKEIVRDFISNFKNMDAQYKIVWSVRILGWILILSFAVFGAFVRIAEYFK